MKPLIRRYLNAFGSEARPKRKHVKAFLKADDGLKLALHQYGDKLRIAKWLLEPAPMHPVRAAQDWNIPAIESATALAEWLQVSPGELE